MDSLFEDNWRRSIYFHSEYALAIKNIYTSPLMHGVAIAADPEFSFRIGLSFYKCVPRAAADVWETLLDSVGDSEAAESFQL